MVVSLPFLLLTPLTNTGGQIDGDDQSPAWSPDGSMVAFARTPGGGAVGIYVVRSEGGDPAALTHNSRNDFDPDWQPLVAGDVNCRGGVNAIDALLVLQFGAGRLDSLPCQAHADVNGDGRIDSVDAALILQYDARLIDYLPV